MSHPSAHVGGHGSYGWQQQVLTGQASGPSAPLKDSSTHASSASSQGPTSSSGGHAPPKSHGGSTQQVIGNYVIGKTIGKGSFGKVKLGRHVPTGESVAIKILNRMMLKNAKMDKKISREIRILKLFSHPNICRLYEVITTQTEIFLIMEYVNDGELYDYIVNSKRLREETARYLLQQIVCALEYCHHFRVVHRDLKPENILLGPNLQVKLIDFGLSNIMTDGEFLATSCGSPNYAAPEVISGKLYFGPEVDVWSCGVIMYALLFGCLPFDADTIPLLFAKIKKGKFDIPKDISPGARKLLEQMLIVDPLVRLTIPQIRDNPWFNINLPMQLAYNEANFLSQESRISPTLVSRACKLLGVKEREVRQSIESRSGPAYVAYSILLDAERRAQFASEARKLGINVSDEGSGSRPPAFQLSATERELNLGLLLSQSPAMEALLDSGNAGVNKTTYNTGSFVPTSAKEAGVVQDETPRSTGTFSISCSMTRNTLGSGKSLTVCSKLLETSSRTNGPSGLAMSLSEQPRVGSVAKSRMLYTPQEESFLIQNNYGWRVGLMTDMTAETALSTLYDLLKRVGMEWKVLSPFRVMARTTPFTWDVISSTAAAAPPVDRGKPDTTVASCSDDCASDMMIIQVGAPRHATIHIFLFRIHEKHDKGYIIDFSAVKGNIVALDLVMFLSEALIKRIG